MKTILQDREGLQVGVLIVFFLVSGLLGTLINQTTQPQKKDYFLLRLMHMDARKYVFSQWFMGYGFEGIILCIAFMVSFLFLEIPVWYAFVMMLFYEGSHFLAERIHISYSLKHDKALGSRYGLMALMYLIVLPVAYGLVYLLPDLMRLEFPIILFYTGIGSNALYFAIPYLLKKVDYALVMNEGLFRQQKFLVNNPNKEALVASVKLQDKDYDQDDFNVDKFSNKHGYEYLNALFFQRHKRLFVRPMLKRIVGIIICFLILDIAMFFFRDMIDLPEHLLALFSPLLMLLYFLSIGEKITRAMFYNCDVSLLRYGYYRQPNAILANFKIRLRKIIQMNLLISGLLCIGFVSVIFVSGKTYSMQEQLLFYASIISASIFFSIHHLFLYYVLQPYTGELEMKSPMFAIMNTVVYFVCYGVMMSDTNDLIVILILVATLVYSIVALIIVYKVAYKTFHIR